MDRFHRQVLVAGIGREGQRAIERAKVMVVGCGALGSVAASFLVRAGVGHIVLVDPDYVEATNLHRQILFDAEDITQAKADVACARLKRVHPSVTIEARVQRLGAGNASELFQGIDVVVDGTDNFATRYEINETCMVMGKPWIYGGVLGALGLSMTIVPGKTPCLRCVFPEAPKVDRTPEGVFGPVVGVVGSLEASETLKLILGIEPAKGLARVDLWSGTVVRLDMGNGCQCGQISKLGDRRV